MSNMTKKLFKAPLLTVTLFSLLGFFHAWFGAFPSRHPVTSSTPLGLQGNPGFTFRASCSGISGRAHRITPDTCLASVSFLSQDERFHNLFIVFMTLQRDPQEQNCQVLLLTWPPSSITFASAFYCWLFPSLIKLFFNIFSYFGSLVRWGLAWMTTLFFITFSIWFSL